MLPVLAKFRASFFRGFECLRAKLVDCCITAKNAIDLLICSIVNELYKDTEFEYANSGEYQRKVK